MNISIPSVFNIFADALTPPTGGYFVQTVLPWVPLAAFVASLITLHFTRERELRDKERNEREKERIEGELKQSKRQAKQYERELEQNRNTRITAHTASYDRVDQVYITLLERVSQKPSWRKYQKTDDEVVEYEYGIYAYMVWSFIETIYDRSEDGDYKLQSTWSLVAIDEATIHLKWFLRNINNRVFRKMFRFGIFIWLSCEEKLSSTTEYIGYIVLKRDGGLVVLGKPNELAGDEANGSDFAGTIFLTSHPDEATINIGDQIVFQVEPDINDVHFKVVSSDKECFIGASVQEIEQHGLHEARKDKSLSHNGENDVQTVSQPEHGSEQNLLKLVKMPSYKAAYASK